MAQLLSALLPPDAHPHHASASSHAHPHIQAAFYSLWGLSLTSWTFYFSAMWSEARPAVLLAVIWVIISGWAGAAGLLPGWQGWREGWTARGWGLDWPCAPAQQLGLSSSLP